MARPRMIVVAGPPGSGKSTAFPLSQFGCDFFNADNRAAELNGGSFRHIPKSIRARVNREFEAWIADHIKAGKSFTFETTLRSDITFEQARLAQSRGFWTLMEYVSSGSVEESIKRVTERSYRGGHSASEHLLREIFDKSTRNLLAALDFERSGIETIRVYDNSGFDKPLRQLLKMTHGRPTYLAKDGSPWLERLLRESKFDVAQWRKILKRS